ncbi:hypothetical protein GCM10010372_27070 [Streptomyces tauricus]|nr:hypothetical protein GCM10010372_27070 [Streptomyces tauricus]
MPEQGPAQQHGDDTETDDVEIPPTALRGPPPLVGRPPTWRDLIRDVLYEDSAQINFRRASLWLVCLISVGSAVAYLMAVVLSAITRAIDPAAVPSTLHLTGSILGLGGLSGFVAWRRLRALRQEPPPGPPPAAPTPADPAPTDPVTGNGHPEPGPPGSGSGEPQP